MAKYQLNIEPDYNFDLIGIISHYRDYQLCWAINKLLGISLAKADENQFSPHLNLYYYTDDEDHVEYFLFSNKLNDNLLLPEIKQIDYFLMLRNNSFININELIDKLRQIQIVLMIQLLDINKLKSKEKLIF